MACRGCGGWPAKRGSFCRRQIWRGPPPPPTPRLPSTAAHPVTWGCGGGDGKGGGIDEVESGVERLAGDIIRRPR